MTLRQIIDALPCLTTQQHKCGGCPFNPNPGHGWPYGCGKGQSDIVQAARTELTKMLEAEDDLK